MAHNRDLDLDLGPPPSETDELAPGDTAHGAGAHEDSASANAASRLGLCAHALKPCHQRALDKHRFCVKCAPPLIRHHPQLP